MSAKVWKVRQSALEMVLLWETKALSMERKWGKNSEKQTGLKLVERRELIQKTPTNVKANKESSIILTIGGPRTRRRQRWRRGRD